ncbi:nucleotidyl transferase AbiEii/AbiGii toxin family protein [Roseateles amylovorans]|uniref:Nucleotidyl transferase AbiEii/AbiGii toxin family protein n=1 Tax=Roseateles amylovorans TaxID=2978473 RepID=A0ABY6B0L4_9BURK|nr:nucleotidyl transferase AbiEii/AbiGii toxin family protein [Roseateles amylovorans]UXH78713.1 nucleotidyl transferase AbiEii/AbiGii toxin family protein [Roseateles amylovorans]
MIAARELAAWRKHAPWSNDLMVEQDYLLSRAVAAIFEDPFLRTQVAMRGGTVLHKGHLSPASRYSEDIDLVKVGDRPPKHIEKALHRVLLPLLGQPRESVLTTIQLAVRNLVAKSTIIRTEFTYDPSSNDAAHAHLKIEVNTNEQRPLYALVPVEIEVPDGADGARPMQVVSYALDEMLGTKLRALLQREQGRDLYDLWWAWEQSASGASKYGVDPARVGAAFRFYMAQEGSDFSAADVQSEMNRRMSSRKFLSDMDGFLPFGRTYDPRQACATFFDVFLPHLDA